jgi:hypothetical protein
VRSEGREAAGTALLCRGWKRAGGGGQANTKAGSGQTSQHSSILSTRREVRYGGLCSGSTDLRSGSRRTQSSSHPKQHDMPRFQQNAACTSIDTPKASLRTCETWTAEEQWGHREGPRIANASSRNSHAQSACYTKWYILQKHLLRPCGNLDIRRSKGRERRAPSIADRLPRTRMLFVYLAQREGSLLHSWRVVYKLQQASNGFPYVHHHALLTSLPLPLR